jgi:hydrogenase nickel incorporation protein HypB
MAKREIKVYSDLSGANAVWADKIRKLREEKNVVMLNLIGSPGCGKTMLLEKTVERLSAKLRFAVLEGDIETTRDAERLDKLGVLVSQLVTKGACHLSAKLVHKAFVDLPLDELDMVIVENVGNLVCPAAMDIGETAKIAVLSVAEGEDKPAKYPRLFREAKGIVITKTDLLPYVSFNMRACLNDIKQINGTIPVIKVSAKDGSGMEDWVKFLTSFSEKPR